MPTLGLAMATVGAMAIGAIGGLKTRIWLLTMWGLYGIASLTVVAGWL